MAKKRTRTVDAPPRNDVYFGMLLVTVACALIGILCLYLETSEYTTSEPGQTPAITLPNIGELQRSSTPAATPAGNPMGGT